MQISKTSYFAPLRFVGLPLVKVFQKHFLGLFSEYINEYTLSSKLQDTLDSFLLLRTDLQLLSLFRNNVLIKLKIIRAVMWLCPHIVVGILWYYRCLWTYRVFWVSNEVWEHTRCSFESREIFIFAGPHFQFQIITIKSRFYSIGLPLKTMIE